ncbi:MAG: LysR family transcriptional regulator [Azospirillaceae bacterium]|nr:LysR family transcriptional regulator [Azospirillaceae bacterium]
MMTSLPPGSARGAIDLGEIDLGLLLALEALLAAGNVTHAAIRLGISQPALSARLNRLRHVFADPLFVPATSGRGVVPTPRAAGLQRELADTLAALRRMIEGPAMFDPARTRRTFVVAIPENPATILAAGVTARVMGTAPGARLAFVHPTSDITEQLERGSVDLVIAATKNASGDLMRRPLLTDAFLMAQRKGHPRGTGALDLDAFCALEHVLVSADGGAFSGLVDEALTALGQTRRVAVSVQNYALAPIIVAQSDCVCTLPSRFLARFAGELDLVAPPLALPQSQLFAIWHRRSQEDQGHLWLRECLYEAADQL